MDIKETFLSLTKHTVPYEKEYEYLKDVFPFNRMKKDPAGNYYIKIGNSNTMFAAHLDTVGGDTEVNHVIKGKMIETDGKSVLGADDKAGVVVLLNMIEKGVPGLYTFFLGEEVGCKGSKSLSSWIEKNKNDNRYKNINKVISFDRKDTDSVITYQMSERCASDEFAESLIKEFGKQGLKYTKDTGGVLTDSVHFTDLYAECTNISVGYWQQHTNRERQDIEFLEKLANACTKVNWEDLVIKRKPGESERLSYKSNNYGYYGYDEWDEWDSGYTGYGHHGGGFNRNWSRSSKNTQSGNYSDGNVTDWTGNKISIEDAVWCEFDKVYCHIDDAIWVDLLGFYTTPDESTSPKGNPIESFSSFTDSDKDDIDFEKSTGEFIKSGKELSIGDNILHFKFGRGKVIKISPDDQKAVIDFDNGGQKQILLSIAKIKKLNNK